jgi:hypothetical protein
VAGRREGSGDGRGGAMNRGVRLGRHGPVRGSILLWVLFVCLGLALLAQALSVVVICAERALDDEVRGRRRMEEKNAALGALRVRALQTWAPGDWGVAIAGDEPVEGRLEKLTGSDWVLQAVTRQTPQVSRMVVSEWLERGRDGVDLPIAAVVADSVSAEAARASPWLQADASSEASEVGAEAYLRVLSTAVPAGERCRVEQSAAEWRLDPGWAEFFAAMALSVDGEESGRSILDLALQPGVVALSGERGRRVSLAEALENSGGAGVTGADADAPVLAVVTGGATLDARDLGDVFGVLVVDEGGVLLDGTRLHGALLVTGAADMGLTGQVVFSLPVLRWATDRALYRVRLAPGTRREVTE